MQSEFSMELIWGDLQPFYRLSNWQLISDSSVENGLSAASVSSRAWRGSFHLYCVFPARCGRASIRLMYTYCVNTAAILLLLLLPPALHACEETDAADQEQHATRNDDRLVAVQSFISHLEQAYSCRIIINSAEKLTTGLKMSVVGIGSSCDDAIDTLQQQFDPAEIEIIAKVVAENSEDMERQESDEFDWAQELEGEADLIRQSTIIEGDLPDVPQ